MLQGHQVVKVSVITEIRGHVSLLHNSTLTIFTLVVLTTLHDGTYTDKTTPETFTTLSFIFRIKL